MMIDADDDDNDGGGGDEDDDGDGVYVYDDDDEISMQGHPVQSFKCKMMLPSRRSAAAPDARATAKPTPVKLRANRMLQSMMMMMLLVIV